MGDNAHARKNRNPRFEIWHDYKLLLQCLQAPLKKQKRGKYILQPLKLTFVNDGHIVLFGFNQFDFSNVSTLPDKFYTMNDSNKLPKGKTRRGFLFWKGRRNSSAAQHRPVTQQQKGLKGIERYFIFSECGQHVRPCLLTSSQKVWKQGGRGTILSFQNLPLEQSGKNQFYAVTVINNMRTQRSWHSWFFTWPLQLNNMELTAFPLNEDRGF